METIYLSYSRVSTNEQGEKGVSIEAQIEEHERWARENHVEIKHFFQDAGYSAGTFKRPGLQELINLVSHNIKKKAGFDYRYVLLVRYQSRLIRDISKKRSLQCVFQKYNVTVQCLNGDWEKEPNAGGIVSDIQMLIDENERLQVSGRVLDSYRHIALSGCYPIGGPRGPLGYRKVPEGKNYRLVPDDEEAPLIRELFEILSTGEYTAKKICTLLNARDFMGRIWSWNVLTKLIDNPIYYGRFRTPWFDSKDPTIPDSQKTNWYSTEHHVEPLISEELFNKVQDTMHRNNRKRGRHVYYFRNKLKCYNCGNLLRQRCAWRQTSGEPVLYKYYFCENCKKRINERFVLEKFLYQYPNWERKMKDRSYFDKIKSRIKNKESELNVLSELLEEGALTSADFKARFSSISASIRELNLELERNIQTKERDWNDLSDQEKQHIIQNSIEAIYVIPGPIEGVAAIMDIQFSDDAPTIRKRGSF